MVNKKGLWFLTLFSLILVLSIYYVTMPNDLFKNNNSKAPTSDTIEEQEVKESEVEELTTVEVMKQENEDEKATLKKEYEEILSSNTSTTEEKNKAYENIKELNELKSIESSLEEKIKNKLELESFVKKESNNVIVTIEKKEHNKELAMEIMKLVQSEFNEQVIVSVKFIS